MDPVESHVNGLGALDFEAFVGKAICCGVVYCDLGWVRLWVVEFMEDLSKVDRFLAVVECASDFGFGGGCHDVLEYSAFNVDRSIGFGVVGWFIGVAQVEVAPNS